MSTWEERMSAKAKRAQQVLEDRAFIENQKRQDAELKANIAAYRELSPEEATAILENSDTACACHGGPDCCVVVYGAAKRALGEQ